MATIGIPAEVKKNEYRVGATPSCVEAYINNGYKVFVQKGAGVNAGFDDCHYSNVGAEITSQEEIWKCDIIVKVKEPVAEEYKFLKKQTLFSYLHLAAEPNLARALVNSDVRAIAYETITAKDGSLPCLIPMSTVAGKLSVQEGAKHLANSRRVLLGGTPGVERGKVTILGGGIVGTAAAEIAVGMGADVTILDISSKRLSQLEEIFDRKVKTLFCTTENIEKQISHADLVIGAVLIPGSTAPKLIKKEQLCMMQRGSVIVDVAIDQGGCVETARPTTHADPVYEEDCVVHYCVTNMPSIVARTSTAALTGVTTPYIIKSLPHQSYYDDGGLNVAHGKIKNAAVRESLEQLGLILKPEQWGDV